MKIWEAIVYGIIGGATELLPTSFSGHVAVLRNAFHMSSLTDGGGFFVRAAICIGVFLAITAAFAGETRVLGRELLLMTGIKKQKRGQSPDRILRRSILLGMFALVPMLCSLFFLAPAERIERLLYIIIFLVISGILLFCCCRGREGNKDEKTVTLRDMLLIGFSRMLSVFPGLSGFGASIAVGRAVGLSKEYNLRLGCMLTQVLQIFLFFFYLIRGFIYGVFTADILLPMLFALIFSAVFGYLAIEYFRYLYQKDRLNIFVYYSAELAVIAAILALINA